MHTIHECARPSAGAFAFGGHFRPWRPDDCLTDDRQSSAFPARTGEDRRAIDTRCTHARGGPRELRGRVGVAHRDRSTVGDAVATAQRGSPHRDWRPRRRRLELSTRCDAARVSGGSSIEHERGVCRRVCNRVTSHSVHHPGGGLRSCRWIPLPPARRRPHARRTRRPPFGGRAACALRHAGSRTGSWYTPCPFA
jgi:hypothetical protein